MVVSSGIEMSWLRMVSVNSNSQGERTPLPGGVEIDNGTLIAGHANALGSSNTVTITKGKLEVDSGVTLAPTTNCWRFR